ncbi:MAG: MFS transporter, partial [Pseudomonadota bacterium]
MTDAPVAASAPPAPSTNALAPEDRGGALGVKGLAWVIFEFARNPYYNMIVVFIFATYFAEQVAGGGEVGFARLSLVGTLAGVVAALTSPILGQIGDQAGRRKPAIAIFIAVLASCAALLWFAKPEGQGGLGLWPTMLVLIVGYCTYTYSETLHNAMLPSAARPSAVPLLSGMALASANFVSVGMFVFFLVFMALPQEAAFGLDKEAFEHNRIVGPFIAVWMIFFIIPFFLGMPDAVGQGVTWKKAARNFLVGTDAKAQSVPQRLQVFWRYLGGLFRDEPNAMRFLLARTIYADGMHALLILGAAYVVSYLGWSDVEMAIYGIVSLLFGAIGALVGGFLDRAFGCRRALMIEITAVVLIAGVQLSITSDSVLFGFVQSSGPVWSGLVLAPGAEPAFATLSDLVYAATMIPGAIAVVAVIA